MNTLNDDIFKWDTSLSVGIETIDNDHKAFFEMAKLLNDELNDPALIQSCLGILHEYINGHFLREEKAMIAANYHRYAEHKHKHDIFKARVIALVTEYLSTGNKQFIIDLDALVIHWLIQHIKKEDMQYKNWVHNNHIDNRPLVFLSIEAEEKRKK